VRAQRAREQESESHAARRKPRRTSEAVLAGKWAGQGSNL
jgi:hypothetical protein